MDNGISRNFIEINFENEYSFSEVYDEYLSSLSSSTPSSALPYDCLSSDDQLYSVFNSLPQLSEWSTEDKKLFENAQAEINYLGILGSFQKMSLMVPGKTIEEPKQHYQLFGDKKNPIPVDDNNNKHVIAPSTATTIISGICHNNQNESISRKGKETVSDDKNEAPVVPSCRARINAILSQARHGLRRPSRKGIGAGIKKPNRRTPIRWTEAEHKLFLDGLEKYGKGDWRSIARHYVRTRSPAQVASHGQKHFIRLAKQPKEMLVGNQESQRINTENTHMGICNISLIKENSRSGWSGYGSSSTYSHGANITKSSYISTRGSHTPIWQQQEQVLNPSVANYGMSASSIDRNSYQPAHINGAMRMSYPSNGAERMMINNHLCINTASTSNHLTSNHIMLNGRMTALDDSSNAYILERNSAYMS